MPGSPKRTTVGCVEVPRVELVVLGLLAEGPMYGYELLERYRARGMDRWAGVGRASVYQALRRLEGRELIHGRTGKRLLGPDPRVYRVTRPGRDRLRLGLEERFDANAPHAEALLGMGFLHLVSGAAGLQALQAREAAIRLAVSETRAAMSRQEHAAGRTSAVAMSMLELEGARLETDLTWLGRLRDRLSYEEP